MAEARLNHSKLSVRTGRREAVHALLSREQIDQLVENFYEKIQNDPRLGAIFKQRIDAASKGDWRPHLAKMKKFWASVLLKSGEYKGQPVVVHNGIAELRETDFKRWLALFRESVDAVIVEDARPVVIESARRIAQSLYLARFGNAGTTPPF